MWYEQALGAMKIRPIGFAEQIPNGAVYIVGVVGGEPLEELPVSADDLAALGFDGELGSVQSVAGPERTFILVGLGDVFDADDLRVALGASGRMLPVSTPVATSLHQLDIDGALEAVATGIQLGSYRFDDYLTSSGSEPGHVTLVGSGDEAELIGHVGTSRAVWTARDWANRPPEAKAPAVLADEMARLLDDAGFQVEVWEGDRVMGESLGGLAAVAAGSERAPAMVVARKAAGGGRPHLALVGKGIVFDSGGLSLKTTEGMETMKGDMAGAAAVVAAAAAIGHRDHDLTTSVYVPLTDNMPGGAAVKPGDVLTTRNGKTIEVVNTDAEGRLVLADALALAAESEPDLIVDLATLTGASRVALGDHIAAVFGSETTTDLVLSVAGEVGERMWALPSPPDYRRLIDSTVADMKNTGGRYGGAIAAALLLAEFVGDVPWAHVDVAGPSWFREDNPLGPKGASGFGVRTLIALAATLERDAL